ncbi:MAG TPA: 23S rRNA (guanosine(2251)-2'-O)-methyltransferase RlmB [Flavipsychrobacter sp.]|nr:23S rRNA (guanosine(2251)-2'-O)-methyltransferase RlmB [Flavipsychrobacter sp.]
MIKKRPSLPLIVGRKPLLESIRQGISIEKIFMLRSATGEEIHQIKKLAHEKDIPLSMVPVEKLNNLTKAQHQGVVAWTGLINYVELQAAISHVVEKGQTPLFIMLDGVTDVRNVGAIARTALCCGAQAIVFPTSSSASLTEEAVKTSAGALRQILLCRVPSASQAIDILRLNGIQVLATQMKGSIAVNKAELGLPTCIVMGAEDTGIGNEVKKHADGFIHIPMKGKFDSLNVSVAAGMVLYEAMCQREA